MLKFSGSTKTEKRIYDNYLKRDEKSARQVTFINENRVFGFSIYFLIFLIAAKFIYIVVEMVYNSIVLDGNSTLGLSVENLHNIEQMGLLVSSTGFILLILPLIYKFSLYFTVRDTRNAVLRMIFIALTSFFLFLVTYNSFHMFTNYILDRAKQERYNAYYLTMLKEGILNNILSYSSFMIDKNTDAQNHSFSVEDKVVGLNLYLLLFVDHRVIQKMVDEGAENIYKLKLKEFIASDYPDKEARIINLAARVRYFWHKYNKLKENANKELALLVKSENIQRHYSRFIGNIEDDYELYRYNSENFQNTIAISLDDSRDVLSSPPKEQLKISRPDIEQNLNSFNEYIHSDSVKKHMIELAEKKYHIRLGYEFDGTFESFKKYYLNSLDLLAATIIHKKVQKKLQKYGVRKADLDYDWKKFISLPFIEELLQKRIPDKTLRHQVLSIIKDKDIKRFYSEIYLPEIEKLMKESIYISKERFDTDPKAQKIGDDALKLLYIPPLAIFFSSLFGVLNFIIMLVYILFLVLWFKKFKTMQLTTWKVIRIKSSLLATNLLFASILIYVPIRLSEKKAHNYPILNRLFTEDAQNINQPFLYTMQWLLSAEPMIYTIGKSARAFLPTDFIKRYGIHDAEKRESK